MARKYTATVVLDGDSSGAVKSLKLTKKQLGDLEGKTKKTSKAASGLKKAFAALAVVGGVTGLVSMAKQSLDAADNIQKLSIRLGASTEALSEYRHVAELSGVSFDALTISWQRQTRRIAEAAQGTGEARNALKELGVEAKELNKLKPEDQFERLTEALNKIPNEADRVRLAMKLWDSEGVKLLQVTNQGTEAMRAQRKEAQALGKSLSRDQVDAAAAANDAMTRLSASFGGMAEQLTIKVAPGLTQVIEKFNTLLAKEGFITAFAGSVNEAFKVMLHGVPPEASEAELAIRRLQQQIRDIQPHIDNTATVLGQLAKAGMGGSAAFKLHKDRLDEMVKSQNDAQAEIKKLRNEVDDTADSTDKLTTSLNDEEEQREKLKKQQEDRKTALKNEQDAIDDLIRSIDKESTAADELRKAQDMLMSRVDAGLMSIERYNELIDMMGGITSETAEQTKETAEEIESAWSGLAESMDQSFESLWKSGLNGLDDFGDSFVDSIKDMMAKAAHEMITRPLVANVSAIVSGQAPAGGITSGMGGISSLLGGQQIGGGIANVGQFLGTDMFSGAGGVANWQYGLAGLGGGLLGGAIGGDTGSALGGIGATIGMATPLGPLGAVLGSLAGGAIGALTGKDDTAYATYVTRQGKDRGYFEDDIMVQSAFGQTGLADIGSKNIKAAQFREALIAIGQIDDAIADAFGPEATARVSAALENWTEQDRKADDFQDRMLGRLRIVLDELNFEFIDLVQHNPSRDMEEMVQQLLALKQVSDFIESDALADHAEILSNALVTARDRMQASSSAMVDMIHAFDGSVEATQNLAAASAQRYQMELSYIDKLYNMQQSVNDMLGSSIESIRLSVMDTSEQYEYYTDKAEGLAAALETMIDPDKINETIQQIDQLTGQAYQLLDEQQRPEVAEEFVDFLSGVMDVANDRLDVAREEAVSSSELIRDAMLLAIQAGGEQLQGAANSAGNILTSGAAALSNAGQNINVAVNNLLAASGQYEV